MSVPEQLQNEKFIILAAHDKVPIHRWSNPKYQFTAEKCDLWLEDGWNYAVLYQTDLCVLDADDAGKLIECGVLQNLPKTFTVESGRTSSVGLHLYFRMPNPPTDGKKLYLSKDGVDLGDVRLPHSKFYNVGPGSVHPSGERYAVIVDLPIATLTYEQLLDAIKPIDHSLSGIPKSIRYTKHQSIPNSFDEYGLTCFDFLYPNNARPRDDEVIGEHPIHGSTTGSNLTIKGDGSLWYCRRCGSGGNWLTALAVAEGIIDCSEAGKREFTKDDWSKIRDVLKRINPDVYNRQMYEWSKQQETESKSRQNLAAEYGKSSRNISRGAA